MEWKYTISSPYIMSINDVICQYDIPIKFLEVKIQIPERFDFKYLTSRYYPINVKQSTTQKDYQLVSKSRTSNGSFSSIKSSTNYSKMSQTEKIFTISEKFIPALIEEPYVNNMNNYRAIVDFEISAYKPKNGMHKYYNTTWKDVVKTIYQSSYFGVQLDKKNHFKKDLVSIITGIDSPTEKINVILNFVKSKMKWNELNRLYVSADGIKKAYKEGVGNSSEINLTLVAMLREAGVAANPVLVSTRSHGIPLFPTKEGFNYVIAGVEVQNEVILLDATEKYSLPNVLPLRVLNWEGRLIRENGSSTTLDLYPKKYNAKKVIVSVQLDREGSISGIMKTNYNNLNALQYRDEYASISEDELIRIIETENNDIEIDKFRITNKTDISKPLAQMVMFTDENQADIIGDKIYISPLLFLTIKENPFKLDKRIYPIDYGSAWKNNISIAIQIPENYSVESKPDNISLELPDNIGSYILTIKVDKNKILINSTTTINSALIGSNHYASLKEFYKKAINNQLEKIVLVSGQP